MPRLCSFETRGAARMYVNPLLVRYLTLDIPSTRTSVYFDNNHFLSIDLPITQVAAELDKAMNEGS
jgi:hypothetical protein